MTEDTIERMERIESTNEHYSGFLTAMRDIEELHKALIRAEEHRKSISKYFADHDWLDDWDFAVSDSAPKDLQWHFLYKDSVTYATTDYWELLREISWLIDCHRRDSMERR